MQKTTKLNKKIELLCPAGDLERLKTAIIFGADAIYCGLPSWSLRNPREITFTLETLKEGIEFAYERGVKIYLTFNIFPHENQLKQIEKDLKNIQYSILNIDGIIVSDLGMFSLIKKHLSKVPIHISTQANTLNSEAVKMWGKLGAERIVLARETTLEEIKKIKNKLDESQDPILGSFPRSDLGTIPKIEVFGHGAMCMAYSGRCLLSKYFTGREANLGDCAQSCRWKYKVKIEEETRPGDLLEVQEDPNGTYFMNSKELCCLDILDQFIESGIDSLKIEGRAKSIYYLAVVTRVYRKAIDFYYRQKSQHSMSGGSPTLNVGARKEWKKLIKELMTELNLVQHRGYSHGFLLGRHDYEQEYDVAAFRPNVIPVGQVSAVKKDAYLVEVKNKFKVGDKVEILTPDKILKTEILGIKKNNVETNGRSSELKEILKPQEKVWVSFSAKKQIPEGSILRKRI